MTSSMTDHFVCVFKFNFGFWFVMLLWLWKLFNVAPRTGSFRSLGTADDRGNEREGGGGAEIRRQEG